MHPIESHTVQPGLKRHPDIKNILAIASGKGGVGKSTVTVNLALALAKTGARVGILDADIYGPSQPIMLGIHDSPELNAQKKLIPLTNHGIQSMSIGYLINDKTPMIWRGPMVSMALQQLLNDTAWDNLDYLLIDLPPGTGDIHLTLTQKVPVTSAIIVTTPQDLALQDVRRAQEMFQKMNIHVLGVVENMSTHVCSHCGHEEAIFGKDGAKRFAEQYHLELLGALPLSKQIREQAESGTPTVVADPDGEMTKLYQAIADKVASKLSLQPKDYSHKFPTIVVKND